MPLVKGWLVASFLRHRIVYPLLLGLSVACLLNCGGGRKESFTSQADAQVVSGVTGIWMATTPEGNTYTLTLCEDTSSRETSLSCETLHKVQGGGRGVTETTEEPTGCGGCDYDYSVYVNGTIEGDDLSPTDVEGQFALTSGDADGKGGFPYHVDIRRTGDASARFFVTGEMDAPGSFDVTTMSYAPSAGVVQDAGDAATFPSDTDGSYVPSTQTGTASGFTFHRVGDASCPAK